MAARRSPATQPSVRFPNRRTKSGASTFGRRRSNSRTASSSVNRNSRSRSSRSSPLTRRRPVAKGGSTRVSITRRGLWPARWTIPSMTLSTPGDSSSCRSSRTITGSDPISAKASKRAAGRMSCGWGSPRMRAAARSAPGTSRRPMDSARWAQNLDGSLSSLSRENHAVGTFPADSQSATRTVFPNPAGAETRTNRPGWESRRARSPALSTRGRSPWGGAASYGSGGVQTWAPGMQRPRKRCACGQ